MTLQSILQNGRERFKGNNKDYAHVVRNQGEILEAVGEMATLLKEKELPRACEDYSNDLDERIHFDDGYTEAINDIISELKKVK